LLKIDLDDKKHARFKPYYGFSEICNPNNECYGDWCSGEMSGCKNKSEINEKLKFFTDEGSN
jgi:hypothetical protein